MEEEISNYSPTVMFRGAPCILASVNTKDSLLIKDIKRLWPIHTVQTYNMQYAFGVQVYGEVLYPKFYSVFSEPFINDICSVKDYNNTLWKCNPAHNKRAVDCNSQMENKF